MTFAEFKAYADKRPSWSWRKGQTAFNALYEERPELANQVRGTDTDPFHIDARLPAFWAWVEQAWGPAGEEGT